MTNFRHQQLAALSTDIAGGVPNLLWNTGTIDAALTALPGPGDCDVFLRADQGTLAVAILAGTPRIRYVGGDMIGYGTVETTALEKQITTVQEQAAGAASIRVNTNTDIWIDGADGTNTTELVAAAKVNFPGGVPTYVTPQSQVGFVDPPTDNAPGDTTLALQDTRHIAPTECVMLASPRGVLADGNMIQPAGFHDPAVDANRDKVITTLLEGAAPAPSALGDGAFDVVILQQSAQRNTRVALPGQAMNAGLTLWASAIVDANPAAPVFLQNSGIWTGVARTGGGAPAGDVTLTAQADKAMANARRFVIVCPVGAAVAPGIRCLACDEASATDLRVTSLAEGGAGQGSSTLTDMIFALLVFYRVGP